MLERKTARLRDYFVTDKEFYRKSFLIIIPSLLQTLINQGVNMMDTVMVGQLKEVAINASSLATQFYTIFTFLCFGVSAAALVLASQYWGAGDKGAVKRVYDLALQLIILIGAVMGLLSAILPQQIMALYTDDADVIREGARYLRITALVYLPHGVSLVMTNIIRATGNAFLGLVVSAISFFVNIFFNYVFIFGKFGFPAMGVRGAALGTLIARTAELLVTIIFLWKFEKKLRYSARGLLSPPKKELLHEFSRLGLPAIISDGILALAASATSMILGHMTREIVSAYAIVVVVERMCTVAMGGVASAAGVVIGQTVGAGKTEQAKQEGYTFFSISILIGIAATVLVQTVGTWSLGLYDVSEATIAVALSMINASAVIVLFQSIQNVLTKGILRGGGDTKFLMVADVLFQWCVSIPLGYLAGIVFGCPPPSGYLSCCGSTISSRPSGCLVA